MNHRQRRNAVKTFRAMLLTFGERRAEKWFDVTDSIHFPALRRGLVRIREALCTLT